MRTFYEILAKYTFLVVENKTLVMKLKEICRQVEKKIDQGSAKNPQVVSLRKSAR
jgi:hypothetical protein